MTDIKNQIKRWNKMHKMQILLFLSLSFAVTNAEAACRTHTGGGQTCDGNVVITAGGVAQNLFGGTLPTNGFSISNDDPTEDCWWSQSGTAAVNGLGSRKLPGSGGWYETPPQMRPMGPVSVLCATTGHKLTAERW